MSDSLYTPSGSTASVPEVSGEGRWMGIDFGEKRIGVALSDVRGRLATPLTTLTRRRGKRPPWAELTRLAEEHAVLGVVVGLPLGLDGSEGPWCKEVRAFAVRLVERLGVPVHFQDERMTSVRAERGLRDAGLSRTARSDKERVDAAAAAVILQLWLDRVPLETGG